MLRHEVIASGRVLEQARRGIEFTDEDLDVARLAVIPVGDAVLRVVVFRILNAQPGEVSGTSSTVKSCCMGLKFPVDAGAAPGAAGFAPRVPAPP